MGRLDSSSSSKGEYRLFESNMMAMATLENAMPSSGIGRSTKEQNAVFHAPHTHIIHRRTESSFFLIFLLCAPEKCGRPFDVNLSTG